MTNSSFPYAQTITPPKTGPVGSPARLSARSVPDEERRNAARAGQIVLAWHSACLSDSQTAGIGMDTDRVCREFMASRPYWLEYAWDYLVVLLGGLAGEAVACGSVRSSIVDGFRVQGREMAMLLADTSGTYCPWPDEAAASALDISRTPAGGLASETARIMNIALRRAKLLLLRDRHCLEALKNALRSKPGLTDAELIEVIGPRPWTA